MNKEKNKMIFSVVVLVLVMLLVGFVVYGYVRSTTFEFDNPIVSMDIEGFGTIKIELYPEMAPETVRNFIHLINEGYYEGLPFHRIDRNFSLIQGGDWAGDGRGGSPHSVVGEFPANDFRDNTLRFERGIVGLARQDFTQYAQLNPGLVQEGFNTGFAQFFIMVDSEPLFDGLYAAFGRVIYGMDIIDQLLLLETAVELDEETEEYVQTTMPVNPPIMTNVRVETFGIEYGQAQLVDTFDINSFLIDLFGLSF